MAEYIDRQIAIGAIEEYSDRLQMVNWKENPSVPYKAYALNWCINTLREVPPADVEPVVRCKDCAYRNGDYCHNYDGFAHFDHFFVQMDDYCSRGARMDGEADA